MLVLPHRVSDLYGTEYVLESLLGEGGQGAVYRVRGMDRVVKLYRPMPTSRPRRLEETLAYLRRLPLQGRCVARPLTLLAPPEVGYVMELMTGMIPLEGLLHPPKDEDLSAWYIRTGSQKRRLRLLARCAEILRDLHEGGMVFVDISPKNVFVSEDPTFFEVWLIDPDNIRQGKSERVVFTPGYAPPEFYRAHAYADSLTDAWSFAVVAFESLNLFHPFCGDLVVDGPPEAEEKAFQGELPFVDHPDDRSNQASFGLPRGLTCSPGLRDLFRETFLEGKFDPLRRPGLAVWAETLARAADQALTCSGCEGSFYFKEKLCPWCETPRPSYLLAKAYLRDLSLSPTAKNPYQLCQKPDEQGQIRPFPVDQFLLQQGRESHLTARHLGLPHQAAPLATLVWEGMNLTIQPHQGGLSLLRRSNGSTREEALPLQERVIRLRNGEVGFIASEEDLHRLLLLKDVGGT